MTLPCPSSAPYTNSCTDIVLFCLLSLLPGSTNKKTRKFQFGAVCMRLFDTDRSQLREVLLGLLNSLNWTFTVSNFSSFVPCHCHELPPPQSLCPFLCSTCCDNWWQLIKKGKWVEERKSYNHHRFLKTTTVGVKREIVTFQARSCSKGWEFVPDMFWEPVSSS